MQKRTLFSFLTLVIAIFSCTSQSFQEKLEGMYGDIVPTITSNEAAEKLENENVVVLDTRSKKEYRVSHIKGALFVDYDNFDPEKITHISKEEPIIVYCTVGVRSERIGEQLMEMGFVNVSNIYGGIFEWKNNGQILVNKDNIVTDSVHTYNKKWSKWLNKGIKVYE